MRLRARLRLQAGLSATWVAWCVGMLTVPVFGLYANHLNQVALDLQFADGTVKSLSADVQTAAYTDATGIVPW